MIPLDHHFTELLNETIPFPLPKGTEKAAEKVVPKPVSRPIAKVEPSPATLKIAQTPSESSEPSEATPDASVDTFNACTFDCYHDAVADLTSSCHSEQAEAPEERAEAPEETPVEVKASQPTVSEAPAAAASHPIGNSGFSIAAPRSKLEITAEQSVPFEIDTRMMINRPRMTLKDSGLPISHTPEEPDPSIVGESILGFQRAPKAATPSKELLEQKQQIQSQVSEDILDLLEQRLEVVEKPILKAFQPVEEEPVAEEKAVAEEQEPQEVASQEVTSDVGQDDEVIDEYLYENSYEIDDDKEFEEYAIAEHEAALAQREAASAEEALTEEACIEDTPTEAVQTEEVTTGEVAEEKFFPMLQVDRYAWPDFCQEMHPIIKTQLGHLADQLITRSASARNVIAVVGSGSRAGSTSILLGLATALKATGQRVAIIDANINAPHLASSLGLQPEQGWETVLSGKLPVAESLIDSVEDQIALLPLCLDESEKITFGVRPNENDRMNDAMQKMKEHYDLVLVDLGSPEAADVAAFANMSEWIDSAVVVHNLRDGSRGQLIKMKNLMRDYGVSVAGIAENFAPREACIEEPEHRAA